MKKIIFITFFLLFTLKSLSKQNKSYLQKITTSDKLFSGSIGNYPIILYLRYAQTSAGNRNIYSVKGWYYYDKYKKKIPLVGIYDGTITLYVFEDPQKQKKVINFEWNSNLNFWDYVKYYKNLSEYKEKFTYDASPGSIADQITNEWTNRKDKLSLTLDASDISLLKKREYLKINTFEDYIRLSDYTCARNFKLINVQTTISEIKVLLTYDYTIRAYALGMCGIGNETGYLLLYFDKSGELNNIKNSTLESCDRGFPYLLQNEKSY